MSTSITPTTYALDITGENPNNLILNETQTLSVNKVRSFTPTYSPFFANSFILWDANSPATPLQNGVDYYCVDVVPLYSAESGKEICSTVIIVNSNVSQNILYNYQALGSGYATTYSNISALLNSIANMSNQVLWQNVIDAPATFNPSQHLHALGDGIGFEYLVEALNNIAYSIELSNQAQLIQVQQYITDQLEVLSTYNSTEVTSALNTVTNAIANIQLVIDNTVGSNLQLTSLITQVTTALTDLQNQSVIQTAIIAKASSINTSP